VLGGGKTRSKRPAPNPPGYRWPPSLPPPNWVTWGRFLCVSPSSQSNNREDHGCPIYLPGCTPSLGKSENLCLALRFLFSPFSPWMTKDQGLSHGRQDQNREPDVLLELAAPPGSTAQSWPLCGLRSSSWLPHRAPFSCALLAQSSLTGSHSEGWEIEKAAAGRQGDLWAASVGEGVRPPGPQP
jgi:hypothetical protein